MLGTEMNFKNFKISKKDVHGSDVFIIKSTTEKGKHLLFLEWDGLRTPTRVMEGMTALGLRGVLIQTPRGHHFISRARLLDFKETVAIQKMLGADPMWVKGNVRRGHSSLRVSIKYESEKPLKVVKATDKPLKKLYEKTIQEYFYKGQSYFADSALESCF